MLWRLLRPSGVMRRRSERVGGRRERGDGKAVMIAGA
jgi:hypothetical protein